MTKISLLAKTLGLNSVENEIFEYLLEYQSGMASDVRKVLRLDRTIFYRCLSSLENKGIVTISGKLRRQNIEMRDIEVLKKILHEKQEDIAQASKSLNTIQKQIKELRDIRYQKDNIRVFSGKRAFMQAMNETLLGGGKIYRDLTPDSASVYQLAGGKQAYLEFIHDFKSRRIQKNIYIRILLDSNAKNIDELDHTNIVDLKEVRQFGSNLKLDCFLNTCGDRTLFYTKDKNGSWGLVIKDEFIAKLLNTLFDLIWSQAKVVEEVEVT